MKCKYFNKCENANPEAVTCVENGGGMYCGKYRIFAAKTLPEEQFTYPQKPHESSRQKLVM